MLPIAVNTSKTHVPTPIKRAVAQYETAAPGAWAGQLALAWSVILGAITLAVWLDHWLTSIAAIVVVATRQNILALLIHEQTHMRLGHWQWGDVVANLFCGYPMLIMQTQHYSAVHLAHHGHYFKPGVDPDFDRKQGGNWTKLTPRKLAGLFLRDISGLSAIAFLRGKRAANGKPSPRQTNYPRWLFPAWLAAAALIITLLHGWAVVGLYWIVPLVTVFQCIVRLGALCEHEYGIADAEVSSTTPLIELRWWEKLLLPNLNFSLHIYHHLFPTVPFHRLPAVHRLFDEAGLVNREAVFQGYGAYLKHLTTSPHLSLTHPGLKAE